MTHLPTRQDFTLLRQRNKILYVRADILNRAQQAVDSFEGTILDYSYSEDCDSDTRRTISLTVAVKDKSFDVNENAKIWLDKFIQVWVGYEHLQNGEILYYPKGIYTICDNEFRWDATTSSLSLSCTDLTACCNGTRGGYTRGLVTQIKEGTKIRDALVELITQEAGFSRYRIELGRRSLSGPSAESAAALDEIPYDMEFDVNTAVWQKLTEIRDLYPGWEMFFDEGGVFVFQSIPTCEFDEPVVDAVQLAPLVQGEPCTVTFEDSYNVTDLYGQNIEADRFCAACRTVGNSYHMTLEDTTFDGNAIPLHTKFQVEVDTTSQEGQTMSFNGGPSYPIRYENERPLKRGAMQPHISYIVKYTNQQLLFYGECQVHAVCKEVAFTPTPEQVAADQECEGCRNIRYRVNPESPFALRELGKNEIRRPLSGGEYDNLYSNELAAQRADYETWKSTRLVDKLQLPVLEIPWLTTNQLIEYTSKRTGITKKYIVKQISTSNGLSTLSCIEFYPLYPSIVQ